MELQGIIFGAGAKKISELASDGITKAGKEVINSSAEIIEKSITEGLKKKIKDDKEK